MNVLITPNEISVAKLSGTLATAAHCGAVVWFEGVVRDHNDNREVAALAYECYESMARKQLERILAEVKARWPIDQVLVAHRVGRLVIGDVSLVVGVTSAHRREAFEAMQYCIDELKRQVPIWKKEHYVDGAQCTWIGSPSEDRRDPGRRPE